MMYFFRRLYYKDLKGERRFFDYTLFRIRWVKIRRKLKKLPLYQKSSIRLYEWKSGYGPFITKFRTWDRVFTLPKLEASVFGAFRKSAIIFNKSLNYPEQLSTKQKIFSTRLGSFFLLKPSPWPIFSAFSIFIMLIGFVGFFNYYILSLWCVFLGFLLILISFFLWCRDVIREVTFLKKYSTLIKYNLRWGFWLFIGTEALLFFSFFWAFFHSAWEPSIQISTVWPPVESIQMNSLYIPVANTIFLLLSGAALTWLQYGILAGIYREVISGFIFLFGYALLFVACQWIEYVEAFHQVNDSVFGSTMYVLTAFHGAHVIIGTIMLFVCLLRFYLGHFKSTGYLAITLAGWYWHFVDAIWVVVFITVYLWGTWVPEDIIEQFIKNFFTIEMN